MAHDLVAGVTVLVTFILGIFAKKHPKVNNRLIPIQNLLIGLISAVIYYIFTKNFSLTITTIGLFAGGTYDIFNNLRKIINKEND